MRYHRTTTYLRSPFHANLVELLLLLNSIASQLLLVFSVDGEWRNVDGGPRWIEKNIHLKKNKNKFMDLDSAIDWSLSELVLPNDNYYDNIKR